MQGYDQTARRRDYFEVLDLSHEMYDEPREILNELLNVVFPIVPRNLDGPVPAPVVTSLVEGKIYWEGIPDAIQVRVHEVVEVLRQLGKTAAADFFEPYTYGQCDPLIFNARHGRIVPPPKEGCDETS